MKKYVGMKANEAIDAELDAFKVELEKIWKDKKLMENIHQHLADFINNRYADLSNTYSPDVADIYLHHVKKLHSEFNNEKAKKNVRLIAGTMFVIGCGIALYLKVRG